jgi:membrane protease YdiL (CAAX protease family)
VLSDRNWNPDAVVLFILSTFVCIYVGSLVSLLSGLAKTSVPQMLVAAGSFQGAIIVLTALFLRHHSLGWREAFGLENNRRPAILAGVLVACLFLPLGWALQQASGLVIEHLHRFGIRPEEQQSVQTLRVATSWPERATLGFVTIGLAPVAEEIFFRGILYAWGRRAGFPRLTMWVTSILFALVHFNAITLLPLLVLSLLLTLLYERTANLLAPIAAHAFFNALNFGMLYVFG